MGVFDLESSELDRFTEEHLKVLTPLASQVAVAIENARLVDELVAQKQRLRPRDGHRAPRAARALPRGVPGRAGLGSGGRVPPARELGGDLYDFYDFEEGVLGLAVGDVSGKGVPAALYGAFASGTVRARAFERLAPADLLFRVNRTLRRRGRGGPLLHALLRACSTSRPDGRAWPTRACPIRSTTARDTGRCQPIELAGVPWAPSTAPPTTSIELDLRPGDVFVFYSDGVAEAARDGEEYGTERLATMVEKHAAAARPGHRRRDRGGPVPFLGR